jgi:hypothetical protein
MAVRKSKKEKHAAAVAAREITTRQPIMEPQRSPASATGKTDPRLSVQWFSFKPRETMARLLDNTLLRTWQSRADKDSPWTWICYRGVHCVGAEHGTMAEAQERCISGPIREYVRSEYPEPPAPSTSGKRGAASKSATASKAVRGKLDGTLVISVLVESNPKKADAARRFAFYASCTTVADYVAALGGDERKAEADIKWDSKQGWIKLGGD